MRVSRPFKREMNFSCRMTQDQAGYGTYHAGFQIIVPACRIFFKIIAFIMLMLLHGRTFPYLDQSDL